ncbi:hypothetical protein VT930_11950 [Mycobacterium sherrisii]|uniref:hypothetical protein n=1 Tax=Mycobacterium sherrisii TaxID=243061 RepID=UPI002DDD8021|nr:hypothetical protein [Mycobacterium sherrisii]MEC4763817.1 hypothetical protein [Mycobacterium sherrisii]
MTEKLCRVAGCPEPQHGWPLCCDHWRLHFMGFCVVDGCGIKPRSWDALSCHGHREVWERDELPDELPRGAAAAMAGAPTRIAAVNNGSKNTVQQNVVAKRRKLKGSGTLTGDVVAAIDGSCPSGSGTLSGSVDVVEAPAPEKQQQDRMPAVTPSGARRAELIEHLSGGDAELRTYLEGLEPDRLDDLVDELLAAPALGCVKTTPPRRDDQPANPYGVCLVPDCWRPKNSCATCQQPVNLDEAP